MKPKLLTMSAFGSYGGVTQIDFERAGTGLFLSLIHISEPTRP